MATIYVLTQKESVRSSPVGVTTSASVANTWAGKAETNDWFQFIVDDLQHLGMENGDEYEPAPPAEAPVFGPKPPGPGKYRATPGMTLLQEVRAMREYVQNVAKYVEALHRAGY